MSQVMARKQWPTILAVSVCVGALAVVAPVLLLLAPVPAAVVAWVIGVRRSVSWALTVVAVMVVLVIGSAWAVPTSGSGGTGPPPPPTQAP